MFVLLVLCSVILTALVAFIILYLRFRNAHNLVVSNAARSAARHTKRTNAFVALPR